MTTLDDLAEKTDAELIEMTRELAVQIDCIGREQTRRIASDSRGLHAAKDAEANEGGISPPEAD